MNMLEALNASVLAYLRREEDDAATGIFDINQDTGQKVSDCRCCSGMTYDRVRVWYTTRSHPSLQCFEFRGEMQDFLKAITLDV